MGCCDDVFCLGGGGGGPLGGTRIENADVSVLHPPRVSTQAAAAATNGAAAARWNWEKRGAFDTVDPIGFPCIPCSIESYGRLGRPAMALLSWLAKQQKVAAVSKSALGGQALCGLDTP
jgi:hypothetical protein